MQLKKHTHDERLAISRQLCKQIVDTYGDKIVAVLVTGSTAKNLDRPYSDLEMIVIVHDGVEIPIAQYIYDGMSIQIDYVEGSSFLKDARRVTFNWALTWDQFRNRIVLYDSTGWVSKLDKVVAESEAADERKKNRRVLPRLGRGKTCPSYEQKIRAHIELVLERNQGIPSETKEFLETRGKISRVRHGVRR